MATKKELLKLLKTIPDDEEIAFTLWGVDDVREKAHEMGLLITKDFANTVLKDVHTCQDADCGINWDTIENAINYYKE